ncbi:hypothetical protein H2198_000394 [Neophaeococcomyces mojaviensis]|uniref:Uncharacterized protein n=1 Tax=Neophaeococcomyces mojaviensis TaxID=3383035 RepID=A0ACC3AKD5_9EURO|nr:hypothetical protein H2198_000394 [Knufia sp. JES_112]
MDSGHTPSLSFTDINSDPPNDHQTELSTTGIRYDLDDGSAPALEVLDPRGDLKLRNGNLLFQVSSNVLMLSSSYFRKMLQKDAFIEGTKQPNPTDPPTKVLNDDDPASFGLMCKLLHYQDVSLPKSVQQTGSFASVCDYYGTERALSVHVSAWSRAFVQPDSQLTTQDLEELLWIAYVFSLEEAFSVFSVRLAIGLDAKSVKTLELRSMPDTLEGKFPNHQHTI